MEINYLISVIIPVFNAERFIKTAIESVLQQHVNWIELIMVNDGSNDSSRDICESYQCDHVQVITTQNLGAGHARNTGIQKAKGRWILFLDSDDLLAFSFSERFSPAYWDEMERRQVDIVYCPKLTCDYSLLEKPLITFPEDVRSIRHFMPHMEFWTCLYRRQFILDKHVTFFEYKKQDIESAFRFRAFSRTSHLYIETHKLFYIHRNNPGSNVNTWKLKDVYEIKSKVYFALFKESEYVDKETRRWLLTESMFYTKELLLQQNHDIVKANSFVLQSELPQYALKDLQLVHLQGRYRLFFFALQLLKRSGTARKLFYMLKRNSRKTPEKAKTSDAEVAWDNTEEIICRLAKSERTIEIICREE